MGRKKSVPEPLVLQSQQQRQPDSVRTKPSVAVQAQTQQRPGETDQRTSPTPTPNSSSPKSPRSPFISRFSPMNHNLNSQSQPQPQPQHPPATTPVKGTKQPQHIADLQQPLRRDQDQFSTITSAIHRPKAISPSPSPSPSPHRQQPPQPERRLKSSHGRHQRYEDENSFKPAFFSFSKPIKSSDRLPPQNQRLNTADSGRAAMNSSDQPHLTKQDSKQPDTSYVDSVQRPVPSLPSKSDTSLASTSDDPNSTRKQSKPKPFTLLSRTKSHRGREGRSPRHTPSPQESKESAYKQVQLPEPERAHPAAPHKTAAVPLDRSYREAMSSSSRNHSADRAPSRDASANRVGYQEREYGRSQQQYSRREGNGGSFFDNLKREGNRVAESIGKGLFGKGGRSGSTTERDPVVDDEHYVLKVINLPLVEQTRLTRISKRLEDSRDKTEFWMPAFPWRAIDYLNYKGCDVEGLYRVPGSGPQIKKWQRRFDEQHDVDLFNQEDLYDINIIGSMLKAWLRELPEELFPKEAQERIARECAGAEKVPEMLIDELSNLSPFNYYLLFAITCHLSLLLAHSDKNKMDFRNLCICFQPCMKIDAFCFKFLVCDWRDCWKGCKNEGKYIEEEYKLFDQPPPPGLGLRKKLEPRIEPRIERRPSPTIDRVDRVDRDDRDRNVSSSDSSKKSHQGLDPQARLKKKNAPQLENGSVNSKSLYPDMSADGDRQTTPRGSNDLRPLSPIKPLSPLGF